MFHQIFDRKDPVYNRNLANKLVLTIQRSKNKRIVDEFKIDLYKLMKKIVVKNVKNYKKLSFNSSVTDDCHEEEEMYAEAFIVMMKCIEKYKVSKKNCFYFYFNKSLSRTFYRMFSKEVRDDERFGDFSQFYQMIFPGVSDNEIYSIDLVIQSLKLNELDLKILKSKIEYEKKEDFLDKNPQINSNTYYNSIKKIKEQILILIDNGEL